MRALFLLVLFLAGCVGPPQAPADDRLAPLLLSEPVRVEDRLAREPAIVQSTTGALFVAGYQYGTVTYVGPTFIPQAALDEAPLLWRSDDEGATWSRVDVGAPADGAIGNSDVDLAVAPDGTLYFASMSFTMIGHSISVGVSTDDGRTWRWSLLTAQPGADRPWVSIAPDGTAHTAWNDGVRVHHASSTDRGASWQEGPIVHEPGGDGGLAVGPDGELAVRIIPASGSGYTHWEGEDGIAISTDGGATWVWRDLPGSRDYANEFRWADPVAFDATGTLYAAWGEGETLFLARSSDLAESWDVVPIAQAQGHVMFPHLRARGEGEIIATWFTWPADEADPTARVALLYEAHKGAPRAQAAAFTPPSPGETAGEYFQATFLAEGGIGMASTVQPPGRVGASGFEYRSALKSPQRLS